MRRFSECWQALADYPGTPKQREAIEETFHLEYGTKMHKAFQRLDRSINGTWDRSYLTVGFVPDDWFNLDQIEIAGVTGINFRASFAVEAIPMMALHALTHVFDKHFLTPAQKLWFMERRGIDPNINTWNRNVQETFADEGRDCFNGRPDAQYLWPVLLGTI